MNDISVLPSEVLFKIFSNLDRETLINLKDVCEKWRSVVHDISWQFLSGCVVGTNNVKKFLKHVPVTIILSFYDNMVLNYFGS